MKNKLFNKQIPHACKYCIFSRALESNTEVLCRKRGVVEKNDSCRKYKYDVTKREPKQTVISGDYTAEDFLL